MPADAVEQLGCSKAGPPVVEHPHDRAVVNASRGGIGGIDAQHLTLLSLGAAARRGMVQLAVQARFRLVGNQVQGILPGSGGAQPLRLVAPHRMTGAIFVPERRNGFRKEFDAAARGAQRVCGGIPAEGFEREFTLFHLIDEAELLTGPEPIERR